MTAPTLAWWMNIAAKRATETGHELSHGQVKKVAAAMVRIEASADRVDDLDVIIRLHSDPTGDTAVRNVMRERNATNAARRLVA